MAVPRAHVVVYERADAVGRERAGDTSSRRLDELGLHKRHARVSGLYIDMRGGGMPGRWVGACLVLVGGRVRGGATRGGVEAWGEVARKL